MNAVSAPFALAASTSDHPEITQGDQLGLTQRIATSILAGEDFLSVANAALDDLGNLIPACRISLWLRTSRDALVVVYSISNTGLPGLPTHAAVNVNRSQRALPPSAHINVLHDVDQAILEARQGKGNDSPEAMKERETLGALLKSLHTMGTKAFVRIPLVHAGKPFGAITLGCPVTRPWKTSEVELVQAVADVLALARLNDRAETKRKTMTAGLTLSASVAKALARGKNMHEVTCLALDGLAQIISDVRLSYWTHAGNGCFRAGYITGVTAPHAFGPLELIPEAQYVDRSEKPIVISDRQEANCPAELNQCLARWGAQALLQFPLSRGRRAFGCLALDSANPRYWSDQEVAIVNEIADTLSLGFARDRAEQRRRATQQALKASRERFRSLTAMSADWYWEQDDELRFTYISRESQVAVGQSSVSLVGKARWDWDRVLDLDSAHWRAHRDQCNARKPFRDFQYQTRGEHGERNWVCISGDPIFDPHGNFKGYRGTGRKITAQVQAQEELRQHRDHLKDMVEERTRELTVAKDLAETASRAKSEFLANMSHELRTPMHAILSFARLGQDKVSGGEAALPRIAHHLQRIEQSGERLLRLLNDLLDLAKLESSKVDYEMGANDLHRIVTDVVQELQPMASNRQLHFVIPDCEHDAIAWCDPLRIGQVVRNLLSNAIKFTRPDKTITVLFDLVSPSHLESGTVPALLSVSVVDQGVGIPVDELESVFDQFVQSSKTRSGGGGTGLGLSICREIVQQHGGNIWADNHPDGGAILTFTLPRAAN